MKKLGDSNYKLNVTIWTVLHMGSVGTTISGDYKRKVTVGEVTIAQVDMGTPVGIWPAFGLHSHILKADRMP